jgi:AraC-like DNA-binding protein
VLKNIPNIAFLEKDLPTQGFELLSLAQLFEHKPTTHDPYKPHRLAFFAVLVITQGEVHHQLDFETHVLRSGDCLLISPGQVHAFDKSAIYTGHLVIFTEGFLFKHVAPPALAKIGQLYKCSLSQSFFSLPHDFSQIIAAIQHTLDQVAPFVQADIIGAHLTVFLLKLAQLNQAQTLVHRYGRSYELFDKFSQQVNQCFHQSRNVKDYALELAVSYKHLNEVCKQFTKKTAKAFIDDIVVLEARRQLSATTNSIKEIGFACGFDEPTNFLKYFRKLTGETPNDFRAKYV